MVRIFKLINANGDILDLMESDHFGHSPTGLGLSIKNDYTSHMTDYIFNQSELNQSELNLSVAFGIKTKKSYSDFSKVAQFLNYQPLTLSYSTEETEEYLRDCRLASLTKSERNSIGLLNEDIVVEFFSPWYQWQEGLLAEYVNQEGDGKIYGEWLYGYVYEDNFTDGRYYFSLENKSQYFGLQSSSPLEITITAGPQEIRNPSWAIYQDGKIVQTDGYFTTIKPNGSLVVSSSPGNQVATLYTPNDRPLNVYQQQDITKTNFVKAPIGESLLLFENCAGATIRYRLRQEAVLI